MGGLSELSQDLGIWWFSQCPGRKEMRHAKGLKMKTIYIDVGRGSQHEVVRLPGVSPGAARRTGITRVQWELDL